MCVFRQQTLCSQNGLVGCKLHSPCNENVFKSSAFTSRVHCTRSAQQAKTIEVQRVLATRSLPKHIVLPADCPYSAVPPQSECSLWLPTALPIPRDTLVLGDALPNTTAQDIPCILSDMYFASASGDVSEPVQHVQHLPEAHNVGHFVNIATYSLKVVQATSPSFPVKHAEPHLPSCCFWYPIKLAGFAWLG